METSLALPAGTQLGHYELKEAAAQGGFGVVYRAWDTKLQRQVAVKECIPTAICHRDPISGQVRPHSEAQRAAYESTLNDAYNEAQTLSTLHHAQIVPVFDIFRAGGSMFYVMPWLEGGSLRTRQAASRIEGRPISHELLGQWLQSILSALEYLHSRRIIHRDIKPSNIMFDTTGNPILVDFGAALNRATKTDTTTQGEFSPAYASPEQVSGKVKKIGPWTDLYSLAATFYELLHGTEPEPAMARLTQDGLQPLPKGDTVLEESIMRNLSLPPEERCQSAQEWLNWLQKGQMPRAIARKRRNTWLWIAGGGIAMAAFACWYNTRSVETNAPALPAAQSAPANEEAFYRHVCTQLGLDELARITHTSMSLRQETKKRHKQQLDSIVQQRHALSSTDASAEEKWQQFQELESQYKALKKEHSQIIRDLERQGTNAAGKLLDTIYEPDSKYPWSTQEEYLALRRMQPRLEKQYKDYHTDYITSLLPTNDEIFDENELAVRQLAGELRSNALRNKRK